MKLYEYQSKRLLKENGITAPEGEATVSGEEALEAAKRIGFPVALKAQAQVGGRGKAGGIKFAESEADVVAVAESILGMDIKGLTVRKLLVEKKAVIAKEYYFSIVFDREKRGYTMLLSEEGGVDIEETAKKKPGKLIRVQSDGSGRIYDFQVRAALGKLNLSPETRKSMLSLIMKLYAIAQKKDMTLLEINPLGIGPDGNLIIADTKIIVDDNALFRHEDLRAFESEDPEDAFEFDAKQKGFSFVKLDGAVGCIVNGAGLAMATMDVIKHYGGEPANFLDIGGSSSFEKVNNAMNLILTDPKVKSILINIFGGITRCDDVARGIIAALEARKPEQPVIIRLSGTNEDIARKMLDDAGIPSTSLMDEAVRRAVEAAK